LCNACFIGIIDIGLGRSSTPVERQPSISPGAMRGATVMALELFRVDGKVAMITGASRGIGKVVSHVMVEAGAKVSVCARGQEQLDEAARELQRLGGEVLAVRADVTSEPDVQTFADRTLERFGKIDILVNNAGGNATVKGFLDWKNQELLDVFKLNLCSAYIASQIVGRHMIKTGKGCIVNISSEGATNLSKGFLPYAVAKSALNTLTRLLAQELAPKVRVNALSLGPIMTELSEEARGHNPDSWDRMVKNLPLRKIGDPRCVALAALFLCSEASSFITGIVMPVAGGGPGPAMDFGLPEL
jgi:7-alpha-hydroxysteroid dehydrogenase